MYTGLNTAPDAIVNVGDLVTIKPLTWYNRHKDYRGFVTLDSGVCFVSSMSRFCGKTMKVESCRRSNTARRASGGTIPIFNLADGDGYSFTMSMFEKVEHQKR